MLCAEEGMVLMQRGKAHMLTELSPLVGKGHDLSIADIGLRHEQGMAAGFERRKDLL